MPGPQLLPFAGDETLPARVDFVVIGGGVIGTFAALELAERGHSVLLLEKGEIGGEQSSRNWGWVRIAMRDHREVPLMAEAIRLWRGLDERLQAQTGYVASGIAFACESAQSLKAHQAWFDTFQASEHAGVTEMKTGVSMLDPSAFAQMFPRLRLPVKGALYAGVDGRAEPQRVAPLVAAAARQKGASVMTGCAALSLNWQNGRVCAVETERGRVACDGVVLAGGAWSGAFARLAGIHLPQLKVLGSVLRTEPVSGGAGEGRQDAPDIALWASAYAFRRRGDGGYSIASAQENVFEIVPDSFRHLKAFWPMVRQEWRSFRPRFSGAALDEWRGAAAGAEGLAGLLRKYRVLDPAPAKARTERALQRLRQDHPAFAGLAVAQHWAGMIDVTPDLVPVISKVEGRHGLIVATGFSGHGFGISPAAGRLAADLISGDVPVVDPHDLRLSRFSDGSPIEIMGGV